MGPVELGRWDGRVARGEESSGMHGGGFHRPPRVLSLVDLPHPDPAADLTLWGRRL